MENLDVAFILADLADLLEIQGANPFRIRAYRNAMRTIRALTPSLADMVLNDEDLTKLPGIGKDISAHIRAVMETGRLPLLEELSAEIPRDLVQLTKLDGVGPKKARKLWETLRVTCVDELESALQEGRVEELKGFGKTSVARILRSIEDFRKHQGRFLLFHADEWVAPLVEYIRTGPGVERVEVAGSFRRRRETVGDIDLLVQAEHGGERICEYFANYPSVARVEMTGETRAGIVLHSGLSVDLRVIPKRSFGAALQYFTGSMEHNVTLRSRAVRRGLRLNEWGIFRVPDGVVASELGKEEGERLGGETEVEIYRVLGLASIPPWLREDHGEIQVASQGPLPEQVGVSDIRGDLHMHSEWSDGSLSITQMAEACRDRGYLYMAITDHSQAVTVANGLTPERVVEQAEEVGRVRTQVKGIRIFHGLEVDILKDGSLDEPDEILSLLDFVIVSVHSFMHLDRDTMTRRITRALEHPAVDLLAHPTGRLLNRREPYQVDMEAVLNAAREHDVAVELNANPRRLDLNEVYLRRAKELGIKVAIDTDAHSERDLDLIGYGVDQARRGWLEAGDVLNTMLLPELERWMTRRQA